LWCRRHARACLPRQFPTSNLQLPRRLGGWELGVGSYRQRYPMTSIPMERAVPLTVFTAASRSWQFRSGIFCFAMSSTCFAVTVPTLLRFGSADPLARFATFFSSTEAGGVLVMKL